MRDPILPLSDLPWEIRRGGLARGLWRMMRHSAQRLAKRLWSDLAAVIHCTDLRSWPDYEPDPRAPIRPATEADLQRLSSAIAPSVLRRFAARLKQGQTMLIAEVAGEIAAFAWLCPIPGTYPTATHGIDLGPGEYVHYNSVTLPQFRQRGLYTALQRFSRAHMRDRGYLRAYGGAVIGSPAPMRMMRNLGLRPVHLYRERWRLGRLRRWTEPVPPDLGI